MQQAGCRKSVEVKHVREERGKEKAALGELKQLESQVSAKQSLQEGQEDIVCSWNRQANGGPRVSVQRKSDSNVRSDDKQLRCQSVFDERKKSQREK